MIITTTLFVLQWTILGFQPIAYLAYLFMSVAVAVIAHNHNHVPIWRNKTLNAFTDYWLTVFYGFPAFAWIPTHNMNHHSLNNKEGDYTITYRFTENNNLLMLLAYPTISSYFQQKPIRDYLVMQHKTNRARFYFSLSQYVLLVLWWAAAFVISWKKALLFVVLPQQFALFSILLFNYVQHVHADEESEWNHSRNFVGPMLNIMLFNNGYHTVHHERAGSHWSLAPELHAKVTDKVDKSLQEPSFWGYIFRSYFGGLFSPKLRTHSMRLERLKKAGTIQNVGYDREGISVLLPKTPKLVGKS
jgi:fatty acid desaturase